MKRQYQMFVCIYTILSIYCFQINSASYSKLNNLSTVKEILAKLISQISSNQTLIESNDFKRLIRNYETLESISLQTHNVIERVINTTHIYIPRFRDFMNPNASKISFRRTMEKTVYEKMKKRMSKDDITKLLKLKWKYKMGYRRMNSAENEETLNQLSDVYMNSLVTNLSDVDVIGTRRKLHPWVFPPEFKSKLEMLNTRRIFNSHKVFIEDFPFMASILMMGRFWCGGTIIHSDLVVTSAACLQLWWNNRFYRENPRALTVRVGSDYAIVSGEIHDVLEIYFHPNYKPQTLENNIAIIRLEFHIKFNRRKKKIKINERKNSIPIDSSIYILGWGAKTGSNLVPTTPTILQYGLLPVCPTKMCREMYGGKTTISRSMFCAGNFRGTVTACNHDEGGPAVLDSRLVGVISFVSTDCSKSKLPTVFTQVGHYSKWIESIINQIRPRPQKTFTTGPTTTTTTTTAPTVIIEDAPIIVEDADKQQRSRVEKPDNEEGRFDQSYADYDNETNVDLNEYYANEVEESSIAPSVVKIAKTGSIDPGSQSIYDVYNDINEELSEIDQYVNNRDLDYVTAKLGEMQFKAVNMVESKEVNFVPAANNTVESTSPTTKVENTTDFSDKSRGAIELTNGSLPLKSAFKQLRMNPERPIKVSVSSLPTTLKSLRNLLTKSRRPKMNTRNSLPPMTWPIKESITLTRPNKEFITYTRRPITITPRVTIFSMKRKQRGRKGHSFIRSGQFFTSYVNANLDNIAPYLTSLTQSARIMHHSRTKEVPIFKIHSKEKVSPNNDEQIENAAYVSKTTIPFFDASINKIASYLTGLTKSSNALHYSRALEINKNAFSNNNLKQIRRTNNNHDDNDNSRMTKEYDHKIKLYRDIDFHDSEGNTHNHMKILNKERAARYMTQNRDTFGRKGA